MSPESTASPWAHVRDGRLRQGAGFLIIAFALFVAFWLAGFGLLEAPVVFVRDGHLSKPLGIAIVGVILGAPLVIGGQLLLVFLEQRRLLARQLAATRKIWRRLEAWEYVRRRDEARR